VNDHHRKYYKTIVNALFLLLLSLLFSLIVSASPSSDVVYSWHSNDKKIALTFDDGPHPYYTAEILDILAEYNVKATFFMIGENAVKYSDIVRMVNDEGHEIGNHTFSHQNLKKADYQMVLHEIVETEKIVFETTRFKTKLIRPPGGQCGEAVCKAASENDYTVVCWSVDTLDWAHTPTEKIVQNVLSSVEAGDIVLFHDFVAGASPTPEALREIIPVLIERGYEFVTVSELIRSD